MKLSRRITIPFVLLFVGAYAVTAVISISLVAGAVEHRLVRQTQDLARVLAAYPGLQQSTLDYVKRTYLAEVFVYQGQALRAGTASPPEFLRVEGALQKNGAVFAPIADGRSIVMLYDPRLVSEEKADAVRPVAIAAVVALLLVVLLGHFTGRAIARPLEALAASAREITAGRTDVAMPAVGGGEVRDLAAALNRMIESVRRIERLATMGHLAAGVAHEIKNPLSAMKMTVQMLREEQKPEAREPYDLVLREIERLELAAGELSAAEPRPLARERVRLDAVVSDVLELMRRQLDHLHVAVERDFQPAPEVAVDVDRFKRAVMNLVLNGAQAMPQGGRLTLGLAPRDGAVRFSVADTGPGIPADMCSRIFEPFVTTKADGVGLGLALTKRIVEDHGGSIGFDTSERGTRFWIEIPSGDHPGN